MHWIWFRLPVEFEGHVAVRQTIGNPYEIGINDCQRKIGLSNPRFLYVERIRRSTHLKELINSVFQLVHKIASCHCRSMPMIPPTRAMSSSYNTSFCMLMLPSVGAYAKITKKLCLTQLFFRTPSLPLESCGVWRTVCYVYLQLALHRILISS